MMIQVEILFALLVLCVILILDDYFKFLFDYKLRNIRAYKLNYYVHIGSINEFEELKYWENYFKHVVK